MKLFSPIQPRRLHSRGGFTLVEIMTVLGLFTLLIAATVSSQIFGLRLYCISETKLIATAEARNALGQLRNEIWAGKLLSVGNGDAYSFKLVPDHQPHIGNALRIYPTADTNSYVYYYLDDQDASLKRMISGSSKVEVVASGVTNLLAFQAEDFQGNVVSNYLNNRVVRMTLQFHKRNFSAAGSQGGVYDYYQLQTRVARRAID